MSITYFDHLTEMAVQSGLLKGIGLNQDTTNWIRSIAIDVMPEAKALNALVKDEIDPLAEDSYKRLLGVFCYPNPMLINSLLKSNSADVSRLTIEFAKLWLTIDYRLVSWTQPVANILQRYCNIKAIDENLLAEVKTFLSECDYKISSLVYTDWCDGSVDIIFPVIAGFPDEVIAWQKTSARIIATICDDLSRSVGVKCQVKNLHIDIPQLESLASRAISAKEMKVDAILSRVITIIVVEELDVTCNSVKSAAAALSPPELSLLRNSFIEKQLATPSDTLTVAMSKKYSVIQSDWTEMAEEYEHKLLKSIKKIRNSAPTTSAELRVFANMCYSDDIYDNLYDRNLIIASYVEYTNLEKHLIPEVLDLSTRDLLLQLDSKMSDEGLTFTPTYFEQSFEPEALSLGVH